MENLPTFEQAKAACKQNCTDLESDYWRELIGRIHKVEAQIAKWQDMPEPLPSEALTKEQRLSVLRSELAALEAQFKEPYSAQTAAPTAPVDAAAPDAPAQIPATDAVVATSEGTAPAQIPTMPAPDVAVPANEAKPPIDWQLVAPPERLPGYRWPLYQYLEQVLKTGKPRPTAHDVFSAWRNNPPNEVTASGTERNPVLNYKVLTGTPKKADKKAVQSAIDKLILSI